MNDAAGDSASAEGIAGWRVQGKPPLLLSRQEFDAYAVTRDFLDRLAEWSEATGTYPDLSFGTTYVNITLALKDDGPNPEDWERARQIEALAEQARGR